MYRFHPRFTRGCFIIFDLQSFHQNQVHSLYNVYSVMYTGKNGSLNTDKVQRRRSMPATLQLTLQLATSFYTHKVKSVVVQLYFELKSAVSKSEVGYIYLSLPVTLFFRSSAASCTEQKV